jgi:hypothetical protein
VFSCRGAVELRLDQLQPDAGRCCDVVRGFR